jgi:hypothetical protein
MRGPIGYQGATGTDGTPGSQCATGPAGRFGIPLFNPSNHNP